jgi:hypothetical protein
MVQLAHNNSDSEFVALGGLLKATPHEEAGERILYFEASNEDPDHQNEVVLQKALQESAEYFLRHGNIDLSHYTILGPKSGVDNWMEFEIGKPVDARVDGKRTFVKSVLYKGDSPMARNANMVWESLTRQQPPSRWYPSIGGAILKRGTRLHPKTGDKIGVIEKVRWNNVALDRCPVNKTVPEASLVPTAVFAKAFGCLVMTKTLEAGYGTDMAALTGGGALRQQSLAGKIPGNYFDFREHISRAMLDGKVKRPTASRLVSFSVNQWGLSEDEASEWVDRFMVDLNANRKRKTRGNQS